MVIFHSRSHHFFSSFERKRLSLSNLSGRLVLRAKPGWPPALAAAHRRDDRFFAGHLNQPGHLLRSAPTILPYQPSPNAALTPRIVTAPRSMAYGTVGPRRVLR